MPADESATPWEPTEPGWEPAEQRVLDRLELLGELVHPQRGALVRRLREPHTVAELAQALGVPLTRLYHHVNKLEADGLIRVEATRRVGAATERRYRAVARAFELDTTLFERSTGAELGQALGGLFDVAKSSLQRELELARFDRADLEHLAMLSLVELHLSDERRRELLGRLRGVIEEFVADDERSGDHHRIRLFIAAFPESA